MFKAKTILIDVGFVEYENMANIQGLEWELNEIIPLYFFWIVL